METKKCPRCKKANLDKIEVRNALSRRDNKTYICSDCGTDEAMFDFMRSQGKIADWQVAMEKSWLN